MHCVLLVSYHLQNIHTIAKNLSDLSKSQQPSRHVYFEKSTTHSCHPVVKWIPLGNWAELELTLSERQNSKSKSSPECETPWGYLFLYSNLKYVYSIVMLLHKGYEILCEMNACDFRYWRMMSTALCILPICFLIQAISRNILISQLLSM